MPSLNVAADASMVTPATLKFEMLTNALIAPVASNATATLGGGGGGGLTGGVGGGGGAITARCLISMVVALTTPAVSVPLTSTIAPF